MDSTNSVISKDFPVLIALDPDLDFSLWRISEFAHHIHDSDVALIKRSCRRYQNLVIDSLSEAMASRHILPIINISRYYWFIVRHMG
jgi:hypothetical protein